MNQLVSTFSPQEKSSVLDDKLTLQLAQDPQTIDHEMVHPSTSGRKSISPCIKPISFFEQGSPVFVALEPGGFPTDPASLPLFLHYSQFRCSEQTIDESSCPICKDVLFKAKGMYS